MTKKQIDEWVASKREEGFGMFSGTMGYIVYVVVDGPSVVEIGEGEGILAPWIGQEQEDMGRQLLQSQAPHDYKIEVLRKPGYVSLCARFHEGEEQWDQEAV